MKSGGAGIWKVLTVVLAVLCVGLAAALTMERTDDPASPGATDNVAGGQGQAGPDEPEDSDEDERWLLDLPRREEGDPMAKGDVDAPVVLTEWADYRCPFCNVWARDTLPELQRFVDEGTLRIEFRDFAIFGDDSVTAAAAASAAAEQDLFWEFQHALYEELPAEGHPPVDEELVEKIADEIGIPDMELFMDAYRSDESKQKVEAASADAQQMGISSTPTFVIGSEVIAGAQPLEVFESVIEEQAEKHG